MESPFSVKRWVFKNVKLCRGGYLNANEIGVVILKQGYLAGGYSQFFLSFIK